MVGLTMGMMAPGMCGVVVGVGVEGCWVMGQTVVEMAMVSVTRITVGVLLPWQPPEWAGQEVIVLVVVA
jgi:hypothetical protein